MGLSRWGMGTDRSRGSGQPAASAPKIGFEPGQAKAGLGGAQGLAVGHQHQIPGLSLTGERDLLAEVLIQGGGARHLHLAGPLDGDPVEGGGVGIGDALLQLIQLPEAGGGPGHPEGHEGPAVLDGHAHPPQVGDVGQLADVLDGQVEAQIRSLAAVAAPGLVAGHDRERQGLLALEEASPHGR